MKELRIGVPEGYEIDKENSTFECIKFKKKQEIKTWNDLCDAGAISEEIRLSGYCIGEDSNIWMALRLRVEDENRNVFLTEKGAISARAAAMISQLMPYYGWAITKEEWGDRDVEKHIIRRICNSLGYNYTYDSYHFLAFHTPEQRDDFYKNNEQLVRDYLMLD